jgi:hypothetical protein
VRPFSRTPYWKSTAIAVAAALAAGCVAVGGPSAPTTTSPQESRERLSKLTVAASGSMRGYSRARFPHWRPAGEGCDVRDEVLRRDGTDVKRRGCNVVGGRWVSPYDERVMTSLSEVDVDHVVPLAAAWRSGASEWTDDRREDFANDLVRPELLAVSRTANRGKGDQDPAQWRPSNRGYWCRYAQDWVAVKAYWKLTVTIAEKIALTEMLETCRWDSPTAGARTSSLGRVG